jgi:hypothetical protein
MRSPVPQSKRNPEMNDDGDFEDFEPIADEVFDPIPPTKSESGFGNSERSVFSNGRLDLVPLARQPETRFQHGLQAIAWALSTGCRDGIPDALRRASYADPAEFWQDFLSQRMTAGDFIHRMASFHFSPAMNGIDLIEMGLSSLLKEAARDEEPFILKNGKIEPGGAVRWLLSMPRQRSHVPPELAAHIEGQCAPESPSQTEAVEPPSASNPGASVPSKTKVNAIHMKGIPAKVSTAPSARKLGRRARKMPEVEAAMRKMDQAALDQMIEKEMESHFGASRFTCRTARNKVLNR